MTRRLILVRHGVTDWNRDGRFQGHLDPPLSAAGRAEARLLARRLAAAADERPVRIVSSPLARAAATARMLAAGLDQPEPGAGDVALDDRLMEIGQGTWEGRTHRELAVEDAGRYATWRRHAGGMQPPGGESIRHALARVRAALDELVADGASPICVVSHGGTLRLAARHLLGLTPRRAWAMDLDNASVSVLARDSDHVSWRVERWNDVGHLLGRATLHIDEADGAPLAL